MSRGGWGLKILRYVGGGGGSEKKVESTNRVKNVSLI